MPIPTERGREPWSGPTRLRVLLTADDFGLTSATNAAILEAHRGGLLGATSVLAVAPAAEGGLRDLVAATDLAVGVHLALVGEDPPLLTAREIPTLVDRAGRLAGSWRRLVPRLAAGQVDPADVRREFDAQIDLVSGHRRPSHLDTHQHLHLWPSVAEVVVDLAIERDVTRVRVPRPSATGMRARALTALASRLERSVDGAGRSRTTWFLGLDEAGSWDRARLRDRLGALATRASGGEPRLGGRPGTVPTVEVNVHPGALVDADRWRYDWGYGWATELEMLTDPHLASDLASLGVELL